MADLSQFIKCYHGVVADYLEARPHKVKSDQLIKWAAEVANGMSYLEKKK
jgi:hypothetical protein